ncbi:hypothetical protein DXA15_13800 [Parabacteroides sp. AM58-2XD]|uniref:glycoside hydrolase family protein n=1 Tax=Parabacteroides TaxID=375288 RepID=UPI000FE2471C|nr:MULTISPECIES: glycoside hydrolase family protein [Parabacteroides]RGY95968.1 hypothetical protein DXA15_13800 [Parabacteroides sp. AM58-2XD]GKG73536.1 hypothetical protein CE91St1_26790 [Parabacteroides goldsteinii]GKG79471.1 hypothetical protein CE91St2_26630 [Parabacteroides goldsteinii]
MKNLLLKTIWVALSCSVAIFTLSGQEKAKEKVLKSAEGKELNMPYSQMALTAKLIGPAIDEKDWFNWCVSPLVGKDKKIHIFSGRWPKSDGMEGWRKKGAEIAHFVADRPQGPFKYVCSVLKSDMLADSSTMLAPCNPRLEYVDGKYVLLYILQNPSKPRQMRIGMMTADELEGPWHFAGNNNGIMLDASWDSSLWTYKAQSGINNPAFLKIKDKYYIYFNCIIQPHAKVTHNYGCAVADKLEGPYKICDVPVTDNISYIEDAQAFTMNDKYYLLTTDNFGKNTGAYGNIILWKSDNGLQFKLKDAKIAMGTLFDYWGTESDREKLMKTPGLFVRSASGKLERPAILKIDGNPAYFYAVGDVNLEGGSVAKSYVFKIEWDDADMR